MIEMICRGRIQDPAVAQEFEHLIAQLRGFLSQSFDADGELIVADPNLALVPVGGYIPYGGTAAPSGWLMCDGAQVSRTTYKDLFDAIGTGHGVGDGSTTFNVPDLRGRFPLGKAAAGTGSVLGATGGSLDHTHTGPSHTHSGPSHTHTISSVGDHTHSMGDHQHAVNTGSPDLAGGDGDDSIAVYPATDTDLIDAEDTGSSGSHDHGGVTGASGTGNTGAGGTGNTSSANPPYQVTNYIIYAGVAA